MARRKKYGAGRFLVDLTLGVFTGGLWWLYKVAKFISA